VVEGFSIGLNESNNKSHLDPLCLFTQTVYADELCIYLWEFKFAGGSVHVNSVENPLSELLELG